MLEEGTNSILSLNTIQTGRNFLKYIEFNFSCIIADLFNSLDNVGKNVFNMIETTITMYKKICKEIEPEFIGATLDFKEIVIQ